MFPFEILQSSLIKSKLQSTAITRRKNYLFISVKTCTVTEIYEEFKQRHHETVERSFGGIIGQLNAGFNCRLRITGLRIGIGIMKSRQNRTSKM